MARFPGMPPKRVVPCCYRSVEISGFSLTPGRNLAFWITVRVPEETSPGEDRTELRLRAGEKTLAAVAADL